MLTSPAVAVHVQAVPVESVTPPVNSSVPLLWIIVSHKHNRRLIRVKNYPRYTHYLSEVRNDFVKFDRIKSDDFQSSLIISHFQSLSYFSKSYFWIIAINLSA